MGAQAKQHKQGWPRVKLTTNFADRVAPPHDGQAFYADTELGGFALRVLPSGTKTWIVNLVRGGRLYRIAVARVNECRSAEQARKKALVKSARSWTARIRSR